MDLISEDKLKFIAGRESLNLIYLEKDYFLTLLLHSLKDIEGIYLKGGTAVNKIFLDYRRLSEDLDFTCQRDVDEVMDEIKEKVKRSDIFTRVKEVGSKNGYIRSKVFYESYLEEEASIIIDLNKRASLLLEPEEIKLPNFYGLDFKVKTVNRKEIVAEKVRALMTRNQPRDYFDVYFLLEKYDVDWDIVKEKVEETGEEYDKGRIFKNAQKVYTRWKEDLDPLVREDLNFKDCIKKLKERLK